MKYNKILITGGYGFIGINFIKLIKRKNLDFVNIDKITYASKKKFENFKDKKHFKFDINNKKKLEIVFNKFKPDSIIHFAAETHVDNSIKNSKKFINSNVLGTFSILDCARNYLINLENKERKKFRVILVSTDEVYGSIKRGKFNENSPFMPNSPYSASKAAAELLFRSWIKTYKFPGIIVNCSNNYGPDQHPEKLIPKAILNFLNNKKVPIYGKGINIRNWLYVEDCCDAILKVLKKGKIGERYNIGGNEELSNILLIKKIFHNFKKYYQNKYFKSFDQSIAYVEDRKGHDYRYSLSSAKIKKKLKWHPKTNLDNGLKKTIYWYINNFKQNL